MSGSVTSVAVDRHCHYDHGISPHNTVSYVCLCVSMCLHGSTIEALSFLLSSGGVSVRRHPVDTLSESESVGQSTLVNTDRPILKHICAGGIDAEYQLSAQATVEYTVEQY